MEIHMRLKVLQDFSWAHRNVEVRSYEAGQVIETEDDDLIRVAREEGWAEPDGQSDEQLADGIQQDDQVDGLQTGLQTADEQSDGQPKNTRAKRATK